ncbi:hypothetical protein BC938DRAFT_480958 [Jimgerdemannia flammicorona]|uniref:Uncharacterized protein n=1 Tax=Jimgerdemannia flammicorona TaxID=994334 RepID=A0A433QH63_9FUNG|nr:hypothetical protein BC938DRAFT_480958 [Jimgerdemannia flammicorona]
MSDSSSSVAEEMTNVFLVEGGPEIREEQEDMSEEEDNLDERAEEADVSVLKEPCISHIGEAPSMSNEDWAVIMTKIEQYRKKIPASQRLFDPLHYYIVDHSERHGPTTKLLDKHFPSMRGSLSKEINFSLPVLSGKDAEVFDMLVMADNVEDIQAETLKDRIVKKLMSKVVDAVSMRNHNMMSEMEHTARNIMPFIDATAGQQQRFQIYYGEKSLRATAMRRNKGGDPTKRARTGYKVDVLIELDSLWKPTIGCGEVSGGLPRCSISKEWADTLKLALELRDVWALAQDELEGVDATKLVVWGFIVVERKLRIYALVAAGGLFHFLLISQTSIPSSVDDLWSAQVAYLTMMAFQEKLETTMKVLCDLNRQKVMFLRSGYKRKFVQEKQPVIVGSPKVAKRSRKI